MDFKAKVLLLAGPNFNARETALNNFKKKISLSASSPDIFTYHCDDLDFSRLQSEIFNFALGGVKLSIFKGIDYAPRDVQDFLFSHLEKIVAVNYLVFTSDEGAQALRKKEEALLDCLLDKADVVNAVSAAYAVTVKDFSFSLYRRDLAGAIFAVNKIFEDEGDYFGPMAIGFLNGYAAKIDNPVERNRALDLVWQADRSIKEGKAPARLTVETTLAKLLTGFV